jgi:hypothetical protein
VDPDIVHEMAAKIRNGIELRENLDRHEAACEATRTGCYAGKQRSCNFIVKALFGLSAFHKECPNKMCWHHLTLKEHNMMILLSCYYFHSLHSTVIAFIHFSLQP